MKNIVFAAAVLVITGITAAHADMLTPPANAQTQTTATDKMNERYAERAATSQYIETRLDAALKGEPYVVNCNEGGCTITWQESKK